MGDGVGLESLSLLAWSFSKLYNAVAELTL
jgi:hypothetical protein